MSARGWTLFAAMSVIWGIPYLLIKVAVEGVSVPVLVLARTAIGAAVLLPLAMFRPGWALVRQGEIADFARVRATQLERIRRAAQQVLLRAAVAPVGVVVSAGSGAFLVSELARSLRHPATGFARLVTSRLEDPEFLDACAPAAAVAILAGRAHR